MALINSPPNSPVDTLTARGLLAAPSEGWRAWFMSVYVVCGALTQSGTTAKRPVNLLWTGRTYFDTTLGKPIWYLTVGWVDATGAAV